MSITLRRSAATLAALTMALGLFFIIQPQRADAATAGCSRTACTVYLSNSETRALGSGRIPAPPAATPGPLRGAYYALASGHRWFAGQYGKRGWCSAFTLSYVPWATQGYYGYRC